MATDEKINVIIDFVVKNQKRMDFLRNEVAGIGNKIKDVTPKLINFSNNMETFQQKRSVMEEKVRKNLDKSRISE